MTWSGMTITAGTETLYNNTGDAAVTNISTDHRCIQTTSAVTANAGTTWKETNAIVLINPTTNAYLTPSWTATSTMEFGDADLTDVDKPIITHGCWQMYDQTTSPGQYGHIASSTVAESGNIHFYGGAIDTWPIQSGSGGGCFWCFKDDEVRVIGVNFVRFGGGRFFGTDFRIQETKMMGSNRLGLSLLTTADAVGVRDLILQDMVQGYYFSSFQNGATEFRNTATRNAPMQCAALAQPCSIIDSDQIAAFVTSIDYTGSGNIEEFTSFNTTVTAGAQQLLAVGDPDVGDPLDDTEVRIVRTEFRENDAAGWSTQNVQLFTGNTDTNGQVTEQLMIEQHLMTEIQFLQIEMAIKGGMLHTDNMDLSHNMFRYSPSLEPQKALSILSLCPLIHLLPAKKRQLPPILALAWIQ